jgi:hypothetical protein
VSHAPLRLVLLASLTFLTFPSLVRPLAAQDPEAAVKKVFADWGRRRAATRSVFYLVEGRGFVPKGTGDDRIEGTQNEPDEDCSYPERVSWLLDFETNRVRKETHDTRFYVGIGFVPCYKAELYDGSRFKLFQPREANTSDKYVPGALQPDLWLQTDSYSNAIFSCLDYPVLFAHGALCTSNVAPQPRRLVPTITSDLFQFHGYGQHKGRQCLILRSLPAKSRTSAFVEYWIDVARDSAVARWSRYANGHIRMHVECEHTETPHGWLPHRWTATAYSLRTEGQIISSHQVEVHATRINEPLGATDFNIEAKSGMVVRDESLEKTYRVDSDAKSLSEIVENTPQDTGKRGWIRALLTLVTILGVGYVLWLVMRRMRSRP